LWTDITVGAVYGAVKRLATEGLLRDVGHERQGNRPTRQLYEITEAGRNSLAALRLEGLCDIWFKYDPFDLALTRAKPDLLKDIPAILAARLAQLQAMLQEARRINSDAQPKVGPAKVWALRHTEYRLEAEVAYLVDVIAALPDIIADAV
jgi:DNA-binding PadR family transcriptional regulator